MAQIVVIETKWFLAQLKPNSAQIAKRHLARQGFETFLPMEERTQSKNGKFVTASRPLFPGYLFVAFDVAHGFWRAINSTQGVSQLVSFGREPAIVPKGLIEALKLRCDPAGQVLAEGAFDTGDQVSFTKGPFANFVGEVEAIDAERRVWVLMDLMGARTRVVVDEAQLRTV